MNEKYDYASCIGNNIPKEPFGLARANEFLMAVKTGNIEFVEK